MRNAYLLLATAATLLAAPRARAQQPWQPFRPGLTYQLNEAATPGDTTHTLRLGAGTLATGSTTDSLFRFNGRVGKLSGSITRCSPQALLPDNLFGTTLRSQPRAVFVLAAANGRAFTLRPRTALGTSWATGLPGLTASVTGRSLAPVLGGAADSVATILLSDGETLRLSKSHGLLESPSLDSYLNGRNRRRHLTLTALPERHLGTAVVGALAVFDYQPGDYFQWVSRVTTNQPGGGLCQQRWRQDSILTRQNSRTGDTVTYTIRTRRRDQGYGVAGAPGGFCSIPSVVTTYPPTTTSLRVIGSQETYATPGLTSFFQTSGSGTTSGPSSSVASHTSARWGGHPEYSVLLRSICSASSPDSVALTYVIDNYSLQRYATGLGQVYNAYSGIFSDDITQLTAFRKGSQTWGTFFANGFLLAARPAQAAATTSAYPNPFGDGLTAAFTLTSAQAVSATLHDALGRAVRTAPAVAMGAGAQQLAVPTAGLPAGVYSLHLYFGADGHTEVMRVTKAE